MSSEIERKFLIKDLPDLRNLQPIWYERYFLFKNENVELRIQKKDKKFELERKISKDSLTNEKTKVEITGEEFEHLKKLCDHCIIRESYIISENPEISIKVYHSDYEGLIRLETEFESENEAAEFKPFEWVGKEITNSPLGRDSRLIMLSKEKFRELLEQYI